MQLQKRKVHPFIFLGEAFSADFFMYFWLDTTTVTLHYYNLESRCWTTSALPVGAFVPILKDLLKRVGTGF